MNHITTQLRLELLALLCAMYMPPAWSEGPCPAGQRMVGQQSIPGAVYPICQPIPGFNSPSPQSRPVWADRWGVIVFDGKTGSNAMRGGFASRGEAVETAMRACASDGSQDCQLLLAYHNQCAAAAWRPEGGMGYAGSPTREGAESLAMQRCFNYGGNCKIGYSDCSFPVRVQ
jgi:hypothetical protein